MNKKIISYIMLGIIIFNNGVLPANYVISEDVLLDTVFSDENIVLNSDTMSDVEKTEIIKIMEKTLEENGESSVKADTLKPDQEEKLAIDSVKIIEDSVDEEEKKSEELELKENNSPMENTQDNLDKDVETNVEEESQNIKKGEETLDEPVRNIVNGRGIMDQMNFTWGEIDISRPDSLSETYSESPAIYIIMDRNLGATSPGTVCDMGSNVGICGFLYQFGNNYGFSYGTIDMVKKYVEESVDLTNYSPSNPYYDSRFVYGSNNCGGTCSNKDWAVVPNPSIWGGGDGDSLERQGPCPDGWYIPTKQEWIEVIDYWTVGESNQGTGVLNNNNINAFRNYFQLSLAGERTRSSGGTAQVGIQGSYFTTEPNGGNPYILRITTSNGSVSSESTYNQVNGYSVRCFKKIDDENYYLVTYNDGVEGEELFPDQTGSVSFGNNYPEFIGSLEREGYQFVGWTESIGSNVIFNLENHKVIKDITLYAKWELICPDGEHEGPDNQCHTEAELQRLNQIVVDLDLYYLVSDGSDDNKQHTIMDRNMGATSLYNKNFNSPNNESKGYLYQWGNNYGFPSIGTGLPNSVLTGTNQVPKSIWGEYVPSRYASEIYYLNSNKDGNWMADSTPLDGIWGGTGDTYLADGIGTTLEGRQGPCPTGYHVPSTVEWQNLLDLYPGDETASDLEKFTKDLLIPPVGRRANNGTLALTTSLSYWSSSPSTGSSKAMGFYWEKNKAVERYQSDGRARARSVRCTKNSGSEFVSKENIHLNGGTNVFISIHGGVILTLGTPTLTSAQSEQATFDGWYATSDFSGNPLSTGDAVQAGSSLYAKFTCNEPGYTWNGSECEYLVSLYFDSMGGTEVVSQSIKSGTTGVRPEDPTKTGYVFSGWFLTGAIEEFNFAGTIITETTTVYAHWNTGVYTITWSYKDANGEDKNETTKVEYGEMPIHDDPEGYTVNHKVYTFTNWSPAIVIATGNKAYTATYTSECEGGFHDDNGACVESKIGSCIPVENGITNGTYATTGEYTWNGTGWEAPICEFVGCNGNSHLDGNACVENTNQTNNSSNVGLNKKDNCPNGDFSDSYYDGDCGVSKDDKFGQTHGSSGDDYMLKEYYDAYERAYENGLIKKTQIDNKGFEKKLTRIEASKLLSDYAINILGKTGDITKVNKFIDVSEYLDSLYGNSVSISYNLGIMGINMPNNRFKPFWIVPRSEFITALSRMTYGTIDGTDVYYSTHMNLMKDLGVIKYANPDIIETVGYALLMLKRSSDILK